MVGMIDVAKSSWLVMSGEEPLRASVTGAGWMGGWGKLEAGYKLALPQMEVSDRMCVREPMDVGSGHFSLMAKGTTDRTAEAPIT